MLPHIKRPTDWTPGSAQLDGSVDSERPTWLLVARRGRNTIDLAGGPMETRQLAEIAATQLNNLDPLYWDHFLMHHLPQLLQLAWG